MTKIRLHGPRNGVNGIAQKRPLHSITINRTGETHHFFASSLGRWTVGYDLQTIITRMKTDALPFNVYMVPGPENRPYEIEYFVPQVDGLVWLAFYGSKDELDSADTRAKARADAAAATDEPDEDTIDAMNAALLRRL